jgi:hypothetical protein
VSNWRDHQRTVYKKHTGMLHYKLYSSRSLWYIGLIKMCCEKVNSLRKEFKSCLVWRWRQTFCFHEGSVLLDQLSDYRLQYHRVHTKMHQSAGWYRAGSCALELLDSRYRYYQLRHSEHCNSVEWNWLNILPNSCSDGSPSTLLSCMKMNE